MRKIKRWAVFCAFVLPAFALYTVFLLFPFFGGTVVTAFQKWNPLKQNAIFVGFENFERMLSNDAFFESFRVTLAYMAVVVIVTNLLALVVAIAIESSACKKLFRGLYFIPYIISPYLVGYIWFFLFTAVYPQAVLSLGLESWNISWFGSGETAFFAVSSVTVWQQLGFLIVMYIAGLQTVPKDILEAAVIDGASPFQQKYHITLPMLASVITVNLFLSITNALRQFDIIYALTKGGPGTATRVTTMDIYLTAFYDMDYGLACAKSIVFMLVIVLVTFIQLRLTGRKEVEA